MDALYILRTLAPGPRGSNSVLTMRIPRTYHGGPTSLSPLDLHLLNLRGSEWELWEDVTSQSWRASHLTPLSFIHQMGALTLPQFFLGMPHRDGGGA